jgi:transcriptional regulator with XRE-family HTH domain
LGPGVTVKSSRSTAAFQELATSANETCVQTATHNMYESGTLFAVLRIAWLQGSFYDVGMIDPRDFASALKELRGRRTQREVAKRARIDPGSWSAYEKGIRYPRRPERLQQIAEGLGVHVLDLQNAIMEQSVLRMSGQGPSEVRADSKEGTAPPRSTRSIHEIRTLLEQRMRELSQVIVDVLVLLVEGRSPGP